MRLQSLLRSFAAAAVVCTTMAGAPAQAASVTYTDSTCTAFTSVTGTNPGDIVVSCLRGVTCTITPTPAGTTISSLGAVTLTASCNPVAATYAWTPGANPGGLCPPLPAPSTTGATQTDMGNIRQAVSGCVYNVVGDTGTVAGTGTGTITLAWAAPGTTAPNGCAIIVTGSPVVIGGGNAIVAQTASSCQNIIPGTTTYEWRKGAASVNVPSTTYADLTVAFGNNSGLPPKSDNYALKVCNGAGSTLCMTTPTKPVAQDGVTGGTGGSLGLCRLYPSVIQADVTAGGQFLSAQMGGFQDNGVFAGTFTSSAAGGFVSATIGEYQGANTSRQITISTEPCDFRTAVDSNNIIGPLASKAKGSTFTLGYNLLSGKTYYFNVRNVDGLGKPLIGAGTLADFTIGLTKN